MIGLDVVFKNPFGGEIEFVGVPPDSKTLFSVCSIPITFEQRIVRQIFIIVAMGYDMASIAQSVIFKI